MEIITKEKMQIVQEIAQINVLISQGKAELLALEGEKKEFFEKRDKELLDRIKGVLSDSKQLLDDTKSNYKEVHEFYELLKSFSEYISTSHKDFSEMVIDFNRNHVEYKKQIDNEREELSRLQKDVLSDKISIESDRKFILVKKKELENESRLIADQRGTLKRAWDELSKKINK